VRPPRAAYVFFGLLDLPLRPSSHRFPAQPPYLFDQPVFGIIRSLEISGSVAYHCQPRCDPIPDLRVLPQPAHNLFVAHLARFHFALSFASGNPLTLRHITLNRTRRLLCARDCAYFGMHQAVARSVLEMDEGDYPELCGGGATGAVFVQAALNHLTAETSPIVHLSKGAFVHGASVG
jgi:hypothetical protein